MRNSNYLCLFLNILHWAGIGESRKIRRDWATGVRFTRAAWLCLFIIM